MKSDSYSSLWKDLLDLKSKISSEGFTGPVTLGDEIRVSKKSSRSHYFLENHDLVRGNSKLDPELERFLNLYLPFCFTSLKADKRKYAYSTAHFAQTLDGKIATHVGHSQWIGNKENLVHAHRMRALSDAVVIGAGTLERDQPKLTVRHVEGETPARVIIGSGEYDFKCLLDDPAAIYQISADESNNKEIQNLSIETEEFEDIDCKGILKALYGIGIKSVYIEGGSYTSSRFIEDCILDRVQLHIAPLIVGSGISNFSLPLKDYLDQSIQFADYNYFNMGKEIMFQGEIKYT